jgi:hypothetical protein
MASSLWANCVIQLLLVLLVLTFIDMDEYLYASQIHAVQSRHKLIEDFVSKQTVPAFQTRYRLHPPAGLADPHRN